MKNIFGYYVDRELTTKRFFDLCHFYGIKNKDLTRLFDVSDVTVSYWRNGTRFPEYNKIVFFAYIIGLPLEIVIIGKKEIENQQVKKNFKRIYEIKEKKYIEKLQELLDRGALDSPPKFDVGFFNPLLNRDDFLDPSSPQYAKLILDITYYGLKKRITK